MKGKWVYQYRAIGKHGKALDFMLSERRDEAAAQAFFIRSIANNGLPEKVVIDKSGSNLAGLNTINCCLLPCGFWPLINVLRVKYLNNIVEHTSRRYAAQTTAGLSTPGGGPPFHQETDQAHKGV